MANFDPNSVNNLIGLWDFIRGNETADTGLDDGIAQNGNSIDGNGVAPSYSGDRLIVGTGIYGSLPVMPEVFHEGERRGVEVVTRPTEEACRLLRI